MRALPSGDAFKAMAIVVNCFTSKFSCRSGTGPNWSQLVPPMFPFCAPALLIMFQVHHSSAGIVAFLLLGTLPFYCSAAAVDTCGNSASCMTFLYGDCTDLGHRLVCMTVSAFQDQCANHTFSYACPINGCGNKKIQSWWGEMICVEADGGSTASFAFADGAQCQVCCPFIPPSLAAQQGRLGRIKVPIVT